MIWLTGAACKDHPWLPWDSDGPYRVQVPSGLLREALDVCRGCPVRLDCLEDADATEVQVSDIRGVRGGLTAPERLRRRVG